MSVEVERSGITWESDASDDSASTSVSSASSVSDGSAKRGADKAKRRKERGQVESGAECVKGRRKGLTLAILLSLSLEQQHHSVVVARESL